MTPTDRKDIEEFGDIQEVKRVEVLGFRVGV